MRADQHFFAISCHSSSREHLPELAPSCCQWRIEQSEQTLTSYGWLHTIDIQGLPGLRRADPSAPLDEMVCLICPIILFLSAVVKNWHRVGTFPGKPTSWLHGRNAFRWLWQCRLHPGADARASAPAGYKCLLYQFNRLDGQYQSVAGLLLILAFPVSPQTVPLPVVPSRRDRRVLVPSPGLVKPRL